MDGPVLDSKKIIETIQILSIRIGERFPGSGLFHVSKNLFKVAKETDNTILWIAKPKYSYRIGVGFFIAAVVAGLVYAIVQLEVESNIFTLSSFVEFSESALNDIVLLGAAIFFLVSIEVRAKRKKVISAINRLRCISHIIDAHQLTKDPDALVKNATSTKHSPKRTMTAYELGRYLDYCTELLSLVSKVGFLYVQNFDDSDSVNAVNDLENLTTGLSRKIWQKIMILRRSVDM